MAEPRLTLRLIGLRAKMAEMGCTDDDLERRKAAALQMFDEWNDVTGAIGTGSSWFWELKSIIEDAVEIGMLGETLEEPDGEGLGERM
jgi:hypothetical protein